MPSEQKMAENYLQIYICNAQLSRMLYNLTGDIKHMCRTSSKEVLVKRILKITGKPSTPTSIPIAAAPAPAPAPAPTPILVTTVSTSPTTTGIKRSLDEAAITDATTSLALQPAKIIAVKVPRNCLSSLSQLQLVQMKRVIAMHQIHVMALQHDKDLRPLWSSIGMKAQYPKMTGKEKVMEKLKAFAQVNLQFHGHMAQ